jgi:ubiquinone/menaquinone biosynthesis C-methylase UbiE
VVKDIRIPFPNNEADFASFFSVFTHLLHEEAFCYLLESKRVVKRGGLIVFSFLEFEDNWEIFKDRWHHVRDHEPNAHLWTSA